MPREAAVKCLAELPNENKLRGNGRQIAQVVHATEKHITMVGYFQGWHYFQNVSHIIRQHFQFGAKAIRSAEEFLLSMITQYKHNANVTGDATLIAVHVRRSDYLSKSAKAMGRPVATADYFHTAMSYFRRQYTNCLFLVASDDPQWCREHLLARDVMLIADHTFNSTAMFADDIERDVSVLRLVEHSILSTGTFSWWIGWFTPGEVVYYNKPRAGRRSLIPASLPHWKGMV